MNVQCTYTAQCSALIIIFLGYGLYMYMYDCMGRLVSPLVTALVSLWNCCLYTQICA